MGNPERETLILMNDADRDEGFFTFSTSRRCDFERLVKRIGGERELTSLQIETLENVPIQWNCKVPMAYYSSTFFGVKKPRTFSDSERERLAAQLAKARKEGK